MTNVFYLIGTLNTLYILGLVQYLRNKINAKYKII